jgi:hypothetical protein
MTRLTRGQTAFNAGEISPRLYSQVTFGKYDNALETATNAIVTPHGPIHRRNGSEYVAEVKDSTKAVKLIPFEFNQDISLLLEFGDTYMRVYTSTGQVREADKAISGITQANPAVVTTATHGYENGDQVYLTEIVGMTELNGRRFTVANKTATTFELTGEDSTSHTVYSSAGVSNKVFELTTPWDETEVDDLTFVQFGKAMYFAHPDFAPRKLTYTSNTSWVLEQVNFLPAPTYEKGYAPATTLTPAATTGSAVNFTAGAATWLDADIGRQIINSADGETGRASITGVTSSTVAVCDILEDFTDTNAIASGDWKMDLSPICDLTPSGTASGSIIELTADLVDSTTAVDTFRSADVGRYILIAGGVCQITSLTSANTVEVEILKSLNSEAETSSWTIEDPTWDATRGFPRAIGLYQERLVFGGTDAQPQTIWMSEQGIFDGFGVGPDDEDSIEVDISSSKVNQINWIGTTRDLILGTSGSESTIDSGTATAVAPSAISQIPRTYHGSETQTPVVIGNEVLFLQKNSRKIRTFRYDFNIDNYKGEDLTFLCEHITENLIQEFAYAQEPDSTIYAVDQAGDMIVGAYLRDQEVLGWSKYTTTGSYENVQTISSGSRDLVYVVVNRTINGSAVRLIELFDNGDGTTATDGFSDSFLTYSDPKTITGITAADPGVVTSTAHGFSNGDLVRIFSVAGMTEVNGVTYQVANKAANTFELQTVKSVDVDTSGFTAYSSGGVVHKLVNTITGLDHLEGETVQLKVDGATHPDKTVSSGAVTLDRNGYQVVAGLSYTTTIKTLRAEYNAGEGTMQGQRTRFPRPILRVYKSTRPLINGQFLPARSAADDMDEAVPVFSGDLEYGPDAWDKTGQISITVSDPLPLQLGGIFGTTEGNVK